jgi:endonuclease/exonuclease/phosphatase (EEP) superfamily protein YafD
LFSEVPNQHVLITKSEKANSDLKILQFNLLETNKNYDEVVDWIKAESKNVDVVVLQEVSAEWDSALSGLNKNFNIIRKTENADRTGIMLLSNLPIRSVDVLRVGELEALIMKAFVRESLVPITLFTFHAPSPTRKIYNQFRDTVLTSLAQEARRHSTESVVMVGDFNVTPFSPIFGKVEKISRLRNSMNGFGYDGTWPSVLPSELTIPIDHVLISSNIYTIEKRVISNAMGSDHYPVFTKLYVKRP